MLLACAVAALSLRFHWLGVCHDCISGWSTSHERREKVSVLGRMGSVDQQPSREPEVGNEGREDQGPRNQAIVTGEEEVQRGVDEVGDSGNPH